MEEIIYKNRFEKTVPILSESRSQSTQELLASTRFAAELDNPPPPHSAELDAEAPPALSAELMGDLPAMSVVTSQQPVDEKKGWRSDLRSQSATSATTPSTVLTDDISSPGFAELDASTGATSPSPMSPEEGYPLTKEKSEGSILSRGFRSMGTRKLSNKFSLRKSKTQG